MAAILTTGKDRAQQRKRPWRVLSGLALAGLAGAGFVLLGGGPARAENCPEYPGQTHEQIIYKVEGRLQGDWDLLIQTTRRAIKRQAAKGEDTSMGQLFVEVATCLRQEVKDGYYGDVVAEARANPRGSGKPAAAATASQSEPAPPAVLIPPGGGQTVSSQPVSGQAAGGQSEEWQVAPQPAPPSTPLRSEAEQSAALLPPVPPVPAVSAPVPPVASFNQGVALPGTAESYQAPAPAQQQQAAVAPQGDYTGAECNYFTRPYQEMIDGVLHLNRYSDGEWVCNNDVMYACAVGVWQNMGSCKQYSLWETRLSTTLEVKPR